MQKKRLALFLMFFLLFIFNMKFCYADIYRAHIMGSDVNLRKGPGTNYEVIKSLSLGSAFNLASETLFKSEKDCANGWYKIYYDANSEGYVCSDYVSLTTLVYNATPTTECEKELSEQGFPSTYWPGICELKDAHPKWQFKAMQTGLDWSSAIDNESSCNKSYIASSNPANIDPSCINQYSSTWYPASSTAVAYYMDPRNFLTEQYIFQFEYLKYDLAFENLYIDATTDVIDGAEFYKYHYNIGNKLGNIINDVGKELNVSPIFIASRILQELGNGTALYNLYSGVYSGYENYFNFYNFGVTDSCATTKGTTVCGLSYAKTNNWYGLHAAIKGGASQIASSYIDKGQYTTYLQKFNVVPTDSSKLYGHQYMTNVAAPSSEAKTSYNTYKNANLLDNVFVFYIPVYNNMDNSDYTESHGAIETPDDENNLSSLDISTIVVSGNYQYSSGKIGGIKQNTNVATIKNTLESIAGRGSVIIKNHEGTLVTDGLIGTGFTVEIKNAKTSESLKAIVAGDTSGDGIINALDLLQVQKNILGIYSLNEEYYAAGDTSHDGSINALDLLQVQKNIIGSYTIS